MADSTFFGRPVAWLAGIVLLALVVGGVVTVAFLDATRHPEPTDAFYLSNEDDENHTLRIEVVSANDSSSVFAETVRLPPNETVAFDGPLEPGRQYRLLVGVDDRDPESFRVTGPDDLCSIEVWVEPNASVTVGRGCA